MRTGQRCEVWVADAATGERELLFTTHDRLLEAPNWTLDGAALVLNGDGSLWMLDLADRRLDRVPLAGIAALNNDHVLDPDGGHIYLSAADGHIHRASLRGGRPTRVTADDGWSHFLHGVSPDGGTLAYVGIEDGDFSRPGRLMTMPADGGMPTPLDTGTGHCDGPEYSPDGHWLYLNTEAFTPDPGHAQLARIRPDGSGFERLLDSRTVDWFPHLSPDGRLATYLRFPAGTRGHPADLDVELVVVATDDWTTPVHTFALFGGQGTLNVNSWAPTSDRFAYVAYPLDAAALQR
ncbi:biopolymer transporter Tol [Micrococcaceae bacterium RIT802]|nr:biopolymer transporter Tol [Micrococcaceae bacterium RIT 802]